MAFPGFCSQMEDSGLKSLTYLEILDFLLKFMKNGTTRAFNIQKDLIQPCMDAGSFCRR
jgi:hypothetical protein